MEQLNLQDEGAQPAHQETSNYKDQETPRKIVEEPQETLQNTSSTPNPNPTPNPWCSAATPTVSSTAVRPVRSVRKPSFNILADEAEEEKVEVSPVKQVPLAEDITPKLELKVDLNTNDIAQEKFEDNETRNSFDHFLEPNHREAFGNDASSIADSDRARSPQPSLSSLRVPATGVRPKFEVTVSDPRRIGDPINPYIVYKVTTKTTSSAFRSQHFSVDRRYRDFLWLYNQLTTGNPGVIVPPVPEKHALGRFQGEFVESRRVALEQCLVKITAHPMLYGDPDLKIFLESENFTRDVKERRRDNSKGIMRAFGDAVSSATSFSKFAETDEWFENKRNLLETLGTQLKALSKSIDVLSKQRRDLGSSHFNLGESIYALSSAELHKGLMQNLMGLGELQKRLKALHEKQTSCDLATMGKTTCEYIRIIGSIEVTFSARTKAYQSWQSSLYELQKKRTTLEKLRMQPQTKPEKIAHVSQDISETESRVESNRLDYEEVSKLIRSELDRFDKEKVEDFRDSVEAFLQSMCENQWEIVQLWEYFLNTINQTQTRTSDEESTDE
ncbi:Vps5-domain-containing protein [Basidiobolus meristosporus CBS 931.73]|uniref:Vps5-domain-containing protein n=1 Tax=Basidiobolus meristosporus CBS 931.73 TaxID=1314790 RepID=A0A1Y1YGP0_9FUNG|nr:Vps5-domain-containing protein [Basidiobolus meristosporus CBS 931.73]|eukprot:ORX96926.1 Vps5-domain-containing protein [Basidiobolus meristosporus CBS 931.73]